MPNKRPMSVRLVVGALALALVASVVYATYTINGSDADRQSFLDMLSRCRNASAAFRREYDEVFNSQTAAITYNAGRSQARCLVDSFDSNNVDLDDLEKVLETAPEGNPSATTRCQVIKHFLAERWYKATHPDAEFRECHEAGHTGENEIRGEGSQANLGERRLVQSDGTWTVETTYNGNAETWTLDANSNITSVTYR